MKPLPVSSPPRDIFFDPVPSKGRKTVARPTAKRGASPEEKLALAQGEPVAVFGAKLKKGGKAAPAAQKLGNIVLSSLASASAVAHPSMPTASEPSVASVHTRQQSRVVLEPIGRATRHVVKGKRLRNAHTRHRQQKNPVINEDPDSY